ncbi:NB-ARC domains-containing protein [Tanacetum coccineum]
MHNRIEKLPDIELEIPHLDIFLVQGNDLSTIPDIFIQGVKGARVLDFEDNKIVSLPPSLKQLTKLCMLNLGGNRSLHDISILGDLKLLEILILSNTGIVEIPKETGNLVNLRRLVVKGCKGLSHIAPNVMSNLRWLEELHIAYYPVKDGNNEGLMEIGKLSMLTFLDLFVPHIHLIPKGVFLTKLKGFVIQIGGDCQIYGVVHRKTLILGMNDLDTPSILEVKELIELSDGLHMLHVLWNCLDQHISLKNLVILDICMCSKLERLFSVNAARGLVNLQTLKIEACDNLKELIWDGDGGDNDMIVFRCLVKIELRYLDELKSFYAGKVKISYPSLEKVEIYGCNIMDKWGYNGTYDTPDLKLVNQAIADCKFLPFGMYLFYSFMHFVYEIHTNKCLQL